MVLQNSLICEVQWFSVDTQTPGHFEFEVKLLNRSGIGFCSLVEAMFWRFPFIHHEGTTCSVLQLTLFYRASQHTQERICLISDASSQDGTVLVIDGIAGQESEAPHLLKT